jgi:hypothetical protein
MPPCSVSAKKKILSSFLNFNFDRKNKNAKEQRSTYPLPRYQQVPEGFPIYNNENAY